MTYNKIIYYDNTGQRQSLYISKIQDPRIFDTFKGIELWDTSETIRLTLVDNSKNKKPNFCRAFPNQRENGYSIQDDSIEHDQEIIQLTTQLNAIPNLNIEFFHLIDKKAESICSVKDYVWDDEVLRTIYRDQPKARFDMFGRSKNATYTESHPEIIIEVIDSHFYPANLFATMRQKTRDSHSLVLFYFVGKKGFNDLRENTLRISIFMKNGMVYYCNNEVMDVLNSVQDELENEQAYYNRVYHRVVQKIQHGKRIDFSELRN